MTDNDQTVAPRRDGTRQPAWPVSFAFVVLSGLAAFVAAVTAPLDRLFSSGAVLASVALLGAATLIMVLRHDESAPGRPANRTYVTEGIQLVVMCAVSASWLLSSLSSSTGSEIASAALAAASALVLSLSFCEAGVSALARKADVRVQEQPDEPDPHPQPAGTKSGALARGTARPGRNIGGVSTAAVVTVIVLVVAGRGARRRR